MFVAEESLNQHKLRWQRGSQCLTNDSNKDIAGSPEQRHFFNVIKSLFFDFPSSSYSVIITISVPRL